MIYAGAWLVRKKKFFLNTMAGILKQVITVVCGFVLPRYMLLYYGSATNGLISSIAHFLGFISLLDMGVGAVIQSNLYKPLADKDKDQISRIVKSSEKFFRRLAYIFIGYIFFLCFAFATILNRGYDIYFTISLLLIISISIFAEYFFGMTYQLLLNADQRSYVPLFMQTGAIILNTIFAIVLMKFGASVHIVKLMSAGVYVLRPLGQLLYVRKRYDINRKIEVAGEPIKQKWNGFSQHLAAVVCQDIDVAVLTLFSTLENISIYSVYFNITNGVTQIIMTATTGMESLFGNMVANGEKDELLDIFKLIEWCTHVGVTVVFTISAILIVPFVSVYTEGITDADYIAPLFGILLVAAYAARCLRIPYFLIVKASTHFKETQNGAYIAAVINIVVTVALVTRYGLIGAALGTFAAMMYHTCYFVWYLQGNILERPIRYFIEYILMDSIIAIVSYIVTRRFMLGEISYGAWAFLAIKVTIIVIMISVVTHLFVFNKKFFDMIKLLRRLNFDLR